MRHFISSRTCETIKEDQGSKSQSSHCQVNKQDTLQRVRCDSEAPHSRVQKWNAYLESLAKSA